MEQQIQDVFTSLSSLTHRMQTQESAVAKLKKDYADLQKTNAKLEERLERLEKQLQQKSAEQR